MSKIKVNRLENTSTANGGIDIDTDGHVQFDGLQMPTAGALSNRNLIMNGAMQVAQRGTSATPTGGGYFTVDRFSFRNQNNYMNDVASTYAQVEEAPAGFKYSQKVTIGTGTNPTSTDNLWLQQSIEGNNCSHLGFGTASAQTFTLSFWVRASIAGDYDLVFQNGGQNRYYVTQYTIDTANTWEYKTITVSGDTSGTWTTDNGLGLAVYFVFTISSTSSFATSTLDTWGTGDFRGSTTCTALGATTGATFQITGVQLEVGSKATPFEHESYAQTLAKCQRYRYQIDLGNESNVQHIPMMRFEASSGTAYANLTFPCEMRSDPNFTFTGTTRSATGFAGNPVLNMASKTSADIKSTRSVSTNSTVFLRAIDSSSGNDVLVLNFDAEL